MKQNELINFLGLIESLPREVKDEAPLSNFIPQTWPTVGALREVVAFLKSQGWRRKE